MTPSASARDLAIAARTIAALVLVQSACSLFVAVPDTSSNYGTLDGGLDAGRVADAADARAPLDFCVGGGPALFCANFEEPQPFARWDAVTLEVGQEPSLDKAIFQSPSTSLLARIEASVTSTCIYSRVTKGIDGSFSRARVALDVRAEGPESFPGALVVVQNIGREGEGGCSVLTGLAWMGDHYVLDVLEQVGAANQPPPTFTHDRRGRVVPRTWQRLEIDVDYAARTLRIDDGSGGGVPSPELMMDCPYAPGRATLNVGFHCSAPAASGREIRFDDVVFDPQ